MANAELAENNPSIEIKGYDRSLQSNRLEIYVWRIRSYMETGWPQTKRRVQVYLYMVR
jgi:hypothetical protein